MSRINTIIIFTVILIILAVIYFRILNTSSFVSNEVTLHFTEIPATVRINAPVIIEWEIKSPFKKEASHIALHFGQNSVAHPQSPKDYQLSSAVLSGIIPGKYAVVLQFQDPGPQYIRAHVAINEVSYWSSEAVITVIK